MQEDAAAVKVAVGLGCANPVRERPAGRWCAVAIDSEQHRLAPSLSPAEGDSDAQQHSPQTASSAAIAAGGDVPLLSVPRGLDAALRAAPPQSPRTVALLPR